MLRLHQITLRNYRAYRGDHTVKLDPPPGLYYVRGRNSLAADPEESNGAAKTTLFDAASWCLYDKTLDDERPGASVEPWSGERPTEVELCFSRDGEFIRLRRGRNPRTLAMARHSQEADDAGAEVFEFEECDQAAVEKAFGLGYEAFKCTVVLPQFGERFLDMRQEDQSALFTAMLGLDMWLEASDRSSELARSIEEDVATNTASAQTLAGQIVEIESSVARESQLSKEFDTQRQISVRAAEVAAAELEAKASALVVTPPDDLPSEKDLEAIQVAVDELTLQADDVARTEADAADTVVSVGRSLAAAEGRLKAYGASPGECPECGQKVRAGRFRTRIAADKELCESLKEGVRIAVEEQARMRTLASDLAERLGPKSDGLECGRKRLEDWCRDEDDRSRKAEMFLVQVRAQRHHIEVLAAAKNRHDDTLVELRTRLEKVCVDVEALSLESADLAWQQEVYKYWTGAFREIRLNIIDSVLRALEETANRAAEELGLHGWRVEFGTEKTTSAGKTSRGFSALLFPPGSTEPVRWKSYCGGERQVWQLATRFAMSEVVLAHAGLSTNIEVLDEPSTHMSPVRVQHLLECLRERALRLGRCVWVVEHHVLEGEMFDGIIDVSNDEEGAHVSA